MGFECVSVDNTKVKQNEGKPCLMKKKLINCGAEFNFCLKFDGPSEKLISREFSLSLVFINNLR